MENVERQMVNMEIGERRMSINWGKGLPPLIAKTIFSKLLISNLPSCRFVCKTWNHLVLDYASSTQFQFLSNAFLLSTSDLLPDYRTCDPKMYCINLRITQSSNHVDFDLEFEFTKSASLQFYGDWIAAIIMGHPCNGLMFISKLSYYTWLQGIFNPMTNEFFQVSDPDTLDEFYMYGFGFSPITKQYKLFRVFDSTPYLDRFKTTDVTHVTHYIMEVLTFGSVTNHIPIHKQWRHIHTLSFEIVPDGVYLNGIIYWLGKEITKKKKKKYVIYALDVETEQIEMSVGLRVPYNARDGRIHPFNGTIYATFYINWEKDNKTIQVWRMQEKYSWVREFVIRDISYEWRYLEFIKTFEDGEILFLINKDCFCFYHPLTKKKRIISKNQKKMRYICQIESLNFGRLPEILEGTNL